MSGKSSRDVYLIVGGSGFVGRRIVQKLAARGDNVSVFDIVQSHHDAPFYNGDISNKEQLLDALRKSGATCVFNTASPHGGLDKALYKKVNIEGTKVLIEAAQEAGVQKLVYTSSGGVLFDGKTDLVNADETTPFPRHFHDPYNESKAKAETAVLAANGQGNLLTVAIRPVGIFGPGDTQAMVGFHSVYESGKTHVQIGNNSNLTDWTYIDNVVDAHPLAADKLAPLSIDPNGASAHRWRGFLHNEWGPVPFWDFAHTIYNFLDDIYPGKRNKNQKLMVIPRSLSYIFALLSEFFGWVTGKETKLTRYAVAYSCTTRTHNIDKAREVLGYEPKVNVEDGIKLMIDWWKAEHGPEAKTSGA